MFPLTLNGKSGMISRTCSFRYQEVTLMRKNLVVTMCALAMAASVGCAEGSGASPAPDPYPGSHAKVTIDPRPYSYTVRGIVVVVGRPAGYAPGAVIYRYWNPLNGG